MVAEIQRQQVANNLFFLDPKVKCARAQEFDEQLSAIIFGQENAVHDMGNLYQMFLAVGCCAADSAKSSCCLLPVKS